MDFDDGDNSFNHFSMDNLHDTDNLWKRCLSNKTCSSVTLTGDVSDSKETEDSIIQTSKGFSNETPHNEDEKMLEINNADLQYQDLELFKNKIPFPDESAFTHSVAINLIDAAVQCTPAERNGSLTSTPSSSFTNVTEMESFNDSRDSDGFSLNSFNSDRDIHSKSSDFTSLSDSERNILSTEGSSVPKKCNVFQKVKKFFGRLRKATSSCCRCQRLH
ncbi:hypothetical protein TNCT_684311 [Trichonephila clavata]|uniref:Uncharacterized protein n=1 Tax=Trichonephila clavata TaxID=2740835 RepID=A0A8X6KGJ4_TRICU|nr:hypothetical protein TNCT_684311 [Trichonephila clavata]